MYFSLIANIVHTASAENLLKDSAKQRISNSGNTATAKYFVYGKMTDEL